MSLAALALQADSLLLSHQRSPVLTAGLEYPDEESTGATGSFIQVPLAWAEMLDPTLGWPQSELRPLQGTQGRGGNLGTSCPLPLLHSHGL